jgi:phosphohistidine phosphatase
MLTLMLLRHAKAVPHAQGDDFARALTDGGRAAATRLGRYLEDASLVPDVAFVSTSARTFETFDCLQAGTGGTIAVHFEDALYNATDGQLCTRLKRATATPPTAMIIGHNPGIMDMALRLAHSGDLAEIERMRHRFPPCTLALLTFDADDWRDALAAGGRLDLFLLPDELADRG